MLGDSRLRDVDSEFQQFSVCSRRSPLKLPQIRKMSLRHPISKRCAHAGPLQQDAKHPILGHTCTAHFFVRTRELSTSTAEPCELVSERMAITSFSAPPISPRLTVTPTLDRTPVCIERLRTTEVNNNSGVILWMSIVLREWFSTLSIRNNGVSLFLAGVRAVLPGSFYVASDGRSRQERPPSRITSAL